MPEPIADPAPKSVAVTEPVVEESEPLDVTELEGSDVELMPDEPETPPETTNGKKHKFNIKVDGKEEAWEGDDPDVIFAIQKSKMADSRANEADVLKRQTTDAFNKLIAELKRDPEAMLKHEMIGIDIRAKIREETLKQLYDELTMEKLDPKDREIELLKRQNQQHETEKQKREREAQESALTEQKTAIQQEIGTQLVAAIDALPITEKLKKSPQFFRQVAVYLKQIHDEKKMENILPEHINHAIGLTVNDYMELLGEENVRVKPAGAAVPTTPPPPPVTIPKIIPQADGKVKLLVDKKYVLFDPNAKKIPPRVWKAYIEALS